MTTIYIVLGIVVLFIILAFIKEKIFVYEDGIKIKDLMYPLTIPNDTIVSINMIDRLPLLIYRTNGTGIGPIQKGYFTVKNSSLEHSENATLYIRNKNASAIEIRTVNGLVYINQKNDELTQCLFDEMKSTVKILKENELNLNAKRPRTYRSVFVIVVLLEALLAPALFMNYNSKVLIANDVIEIKGEYAMEIPVSDIDTVLLVEKLPSIRTRANGISTRKVNIGIFKMSDGNKCRLYINKDVDAFVEIRLVAQGSQPQDLVFINRKTVEDTKALYEEIFNSKY
ncbi:MAG: hypothetical protein IIX06_07890 [Bacteroidales bacterium]|nr:hypothetical protein [Bacteroidales bacterium]